MRRQIEWKKRHPLAPTLMPAIGTKCEVEFGQGFYQGVVIGHGETAPIVEFVTKNGKVKSGASTVVAKDFVMTNALGQGYSTEKYFGRLYE